MNVHRIEKLEKQLASRPGLTERIVRSEKASAADLEDPRVLVVSFKTVYAGPQEGPTQERMKKQ